MASLKPHRHSVLLYSRGRRRETQLWLVSLSTESLNPPMLAVPEKDTKKQGLEQYLLLCKQPPFPFPFSYLQPKRYPPPANHPSTTPYPTTPNSPHS